jgi:hypothetical protein
MKDKLLKDVMMNNELRVEEQWPYKWRTMLHPGLSYWIRDMANHEEFDKQCTTTITNRAEIKHKVFITITTSSMTNLLLEYNEHNTYLCQTTQLHTDTHSQESLEVGFSMLTQLKNATNIDISQEKVIKMTWLNDKEQIHGLGVMEEGPLYEEMKSHIEEALRNDNMNDEETPPSTSTRRIFISLNLRAETTRTTRWIQDMDDSLYIDMKTNYLKVIMKCVIEKEEREDFIMIYIIDEEDDNHTYDEIIKYQKENYLKTRTPKTKMVGKQQRAPEAPQTNQGRDKKKRKKKAGNVTDQESQSATSPKE